MTDKELLDAFHDAQHRKQKQSEAIVARCRSLISTLKDAGALSTAKELEELYFQLDSVEGEITKLIQDQPRRMIGILLPEARR
jgi:hypothetical protein